MLYQLRLNRYLLTKDLRINLVSRAILFRPLLLGYDGLSLNDNARLQRALNSGVRFILNIGNNEHVTPYLTKFFLNFKNMMI